jgi:hypothetical protein
VSLALLATRARASTAAQQTSGSPARTNITVRVSTGTVRRVRSDLDLGRMILQGQTMSAQLRNAVTDCQLEQTTDGASTLTIAVSDWYERLLRSPIITGASTLVFDGISFTLVKTTRQDNTITLTFEETAVNLLRLYDSARKANRANTTRAQFVRSMVREVTQARIPFRCPEVNVRQPIASPAPSRLRWAA